MKNVIILIGLCDSAKYSYAQQLKDTKGYWIVSTDAIRQDCTDINEHSKNKFVFNISNSRILGYLSYGINVVFDTTNIDAKYLEETIKEIQATNNGNKWDTSISLIVVKCDNELARERVTNQILIGRQLSNIPLSIIDKQYLQLKEIILQLDYFRNTYGVEVKSKFVASATCKDRLSL